MSFFLSLSLSLSLSQAWAEPSTQGEVHLHDNVLGGGAKFAERRWK